MAWTDEQRARFEATIARVKDDPVAIVDRGWTTCVHCGDPLKANRMYIGQCPGCGGDVCLDCFRARRLYAAQTCKPKTK